MDSQERHAPIDQAPGKVRRRAGGTTSLSLLIVLIVLFVACFARYLGWMWHIWLKSEYYGHGPLIPLISGYLIYTRRRELARIEVTRYLWGVPFAVGGLILHAAATYLNVNFPQGFAMVVVIFGLVVLLWGSDAARAISFPIAFLGFMVPTGRLLVTNLSLPLQLGAAQMAGRVVAFMGVPLTIHGTSIILPSYTFEVAQACSGLKSTIAMSALAALVAYLLVAPMWKRVLIFAAGFPVALIANGARITLTVMLGKSFGQAAAEGFFHGFSGVLVFVLGLLGLFLVAKALGCEKMREDIF